MLVGGGTGGHFYPLMSLAESLRESQTNPELYYMGPHPYDVTALNAHGIIYVQCPAGKRRKYASIHNFLDFFKTLYGFFVAVLKLYSLYPDVVVSKGGYTSVPVVLAAAFLNIPIVVHESDVLPGTANALAAHFARYIGVSYEESLSKFPAGKASLVGIPMRKELLEPALNNAQAELGIDNDLPVILVLGGSQGAERVNELILRTLDELLPHFNLIHQTGEQSYNITLLSARELIADTTLIAHYHPTPFLTAATLNQALHVASLVISRAGSGSIHEIAAHGKPSILIPIPEEISHDQRTNAYTYAKASGAVVMEEHNLTDGLLRAEIDRIMQNEELYASLVTGARSFARTNAAHELTEIILKIAKEH